MKKHLSKRVGLAVALAALGVVGGAASARMAFGDERATTSALLDELDHDAAHKQAVAETVQRARAALERATRLRAAGDEAHARLADGLAREEAESARDLVRAIGAERGADDARRAATDAGILGDRERALLEEGIARNGRLRAQVGEVARPRAEARTSSTAPSVAPGASNADAGAAAPGRGDGGAR